MNNFDTSWTNLSPNNGSQIPFYVINLGQENRLRIISKPSTIETHWEETTDKKNVKVLCTGADCPICAAGHKPKTRYQCFVIDKKAWSPQKGYEDGPKVHILDIGPQIANKIIEYANSSMYGDPTQYDIIIKRKNTGRDTKYELLADPQKIPLTPEEEKVKAEVPNMRDLIHIKPADEIRQMPLRVFNESPGTDGENQTGFEAAQPNTSQTTSESDWNVF